MIQDYAGMAKAMEKQMRENLMMTKEPEPTSGLDAIRQRFNRLTEQLHVELDDLTKALDPVLKPSQPMPENIPPTQAGDSPLVSYFQERLDAVEGARMRVRALRLLLDL